jgi:hypothetical protein
MLKHFKSTVILLILILGICVIYSIHKGFSPAVRVGYESFEMEFLSNSKPNNYIPSENKGVLP